MSSNDQRAERGPASQPAQAGAPGARGALARLGSVLEHRSVLVGVILATAVATAVLGLLDGADAPTVLGVLTVGLVLTGLVHSNRQHRITVRELGRRLEGSNRRLTRMSNQIAANQRTLRQQAERSARNLEAVTAAVSRCEANTKRVVLRETNNSYRQVEALLNLYSMVPVTAKVPPMRGWPASPDLLLVLVDIIRGDRPKLIVECGSGVSTLWASLALRRFGVEGKVVALEHEPGYARQTVELLAAHGVAELAEVRHAPLEPVQLGGETWQWYARESWTDLEKIDLLFVDGPPAATGRWARFPALPLLGDRLTDDAAVVLDDVNRQDERDVVARWRAAAPSIDEQRLPVEKEASVLRCTATGPDSGWVPGDLGRAIV